MKVTKVLAAVALVATLGLTGCSSGTYTDNGGFVPDPDPTQEVIPTLPPSNDLYADAQEVAVPMSDGRVVTCLRSGVRGGYVYECDWAGAQKK